MLCVKVLPCKAYMNNVTFANASGHKKSNNPCSFLQALHLTISSFMSIAISHGGHELLMTACLRVAVALLRL